VLVGESFSGSAAVFDEVAARAIMAT